MSELAESRYLLDARALIPSDVLLTKVEKGLDRSQFGLLNEVERILHETHSEFHLFGSAEDQNKARTSLSALPATCLHLEPVAIDKLSAWLRKYVKGLQAHVRFILVSDAADSKEVARTLGVDLWSSTSFLEFWRRRLRKAETKQGPQASPAQVSIRKGGSPLSGAELTYWKRAFELDEDRIPAEPDQEAASENDPGGSRAGNPKDKDLFRRFLGVDDKDPRILKQEDDDWPDEP